jgi:hypothetical protein
MRTSTSPTTSSKPSRPDGLGALSGPGVQDVYAAANIFGDIPDDILEAVEA